MIKHIFSDMDGTLLNSQGVVSENNIRLIKESKIPFTLVSARSPIEMKNAIEKLKLTDPQVAFNGGAIFQKDDSGVKVLHESAINLKSVQSICDVIEINFPKVSRSLYDFDHWYVDKTSPEIEYESKFVSLIPKITDLVSLLKQENIKIYKIMLMCFDSEDMKNVIEKIKNLNDSSISIKQSAKSYLEITSNLAQKSFGIDYIQKKEKLDKEEMAAFGDGLNDISMFKKVGTPIAMDNSLPGVKEHSKFVTLKNDQDGVGVGIKKFLL